MIYSSFKWKFTHYYWWREEGKAARQFRNGWQQIPLATVTVRKCNSIPRLENFGCWAAKPPSPLTLVHRCSGVVIVVTMPHPQGFLCLKGDLMWPDGSEVLGCCWWCRGRWSNTKGPCGPCFCWLAADGWWYPIPSLYHHYTINILSLYYRYYAMLFQIY